MPLKKAHQRAAHPNLPNNPNNKLEEGSLRCSGCWQVLLRLLRAVRVLRQTPHPSFNILNQTFTCHLTQQFALVCLINPHGIREVGVTHRHTFHRQRVLDPPVVARLVTSSRVSRTTRFCSFAPPQLDTDNTLYVKPHLT
jgi:hypothetical protein